jgi:hypothetical protein
MVGSSVGDNRVLRVGDPCHGGVVATAVDDGGLPVHGVLVWLLIVSLFVTIVVLAAGLPQQRAVPPASLAPPTDPT